MEQQLRACLQVLTDLLAAESEDTVKECLDRLREMFAGTTPMALIDETPDAKGTLPFTLFMVRWLARIHRSYGWLSDYVHATETTPGAKPVTVLDIRQWQRRGRVPVWVIHELEKLVVRDRPSGSDAPHRQHWSAEELAFLERIHLADVNVSNLALALICTTEFGRNVNVPMVKHQIDRLRKQGRVPAKRPEREDG